MTHYTGMGTEVRENFEGPAPETKVVVNMPQGLGRYGVEEITDSYTPRSADDNANASFEWYLKNHIGSTMLVFGTYSVDEEGKADLGIQKAAYDYRAFGEQMSMLEVSDKVTENFTGKEHDDEIELDYFGARYLDPMLGLWISVDAKRQFSSPYLYVGNGVNPLIVKDSDGNIITFASSNEQQMYNELFSSMTPEAQRRVRLLEQSEHVYNLNYRPTNIKKVTSTEKLGEMVVVNSDDEIKAGQFVPTENGGEIYFDGTAQSLGHELGGHGFQLEEFSKSMYAQYGMDFAEAAEAFASEYTRNEKFRDFTEWDAAEAGGHEYDPKYYGVDK